MRKVATLTMPRAERWDLLWSRLDEVVLDDLDREVCRNLVRHVSFAGCCLRQTPAKYLHPLLQGGLNQWLRRAE